MMRAIRLVFILATLIFVSGCASKFRTYNGPEVTRIVVYKESRKMHLFSGEDVLKSYDFVLGFTPTGDKKIEGDGKTPEGDYFIDRRNPNSQFHLSLGISYPNASDWAEARTLGKSPGGDIFIHGTPKKIKRANQDWTWGCIAVSNKEIEVIFSMVQTGTPISIYR